MFRCNLPLALLENGQGLLRVAAVTRGWNGHRMSQHTKLSLEKKILPPLLPKPFDDESGALTNKLARLAS